MLSKNKIKHIRSLALKKSRNEYQTFIAEGNKLVADMIGFFECEFLLAKTSWIATQGDITTAELIIASSEDIEKVSLLKTPQDVIAVFKLPEYSLEEIDPVRQLVLMLDGVQDPGNLGTIIRLADWFGIEHIICSIDTADAFAPKTVQATMGALAHVKVYYTDLIEYFGHISPQKIPIYGAFLDGENLYEQTLSANGIILMGNEGNGIRPDMELFINNKLYIPNYPPDRETSESLNVAIATSIICAEFRRPKKEVNNFHII